jgi:hypothetical protein
MGYLACTASQVTPLLGCRKSVDNKMDITAILKEEYSLNNIQATPITYGLIDQNYQVISTEGQFFFKIFSSISKVAFNQLRHDLQALHKAGIPVPVEVFPWKADRNSGSFYALYEWVDGKKCNSSIDQMKSVARLLGKVVQAGMPHRSQLSTKHLVSELSNAEQKLTTITRNEDLQPEIQQICRDYGQLSRDVKNKLGKYLPEKLDCLPLHPDFTERNMLFTEDTVVLLCDWQGYGPRILLDEVSCAFTRFCTQSLFEGHLLKERMFLFKRILTQENELIGSLLEKYARAFLWLLIRRQICNTPFRVYGLSGTVETKMLLQKVLLWSRDFVEWMLNNKSMVGNILLYEV